MRLLAPTVYPHKRMKSNHRKVRVSVFDYLSALSEPTRVRILRLIRHEELAVGELAAALDTPQSTISRHLKVLGPWLSRRRVGTSTRVSLRLPDSASQALWGATVAELDESYPDDDRRLARVLAERDPTRFFGEHAEQWESLRAELFGSGLLLPTLLAALPQDLSVADLGCGTGDALAALAAAPVRRVGVDREAAMLAKARTRLGPDVELIQGDLRDLPLGDQAVDIAICSLVLHHLDDPLAGLAEAARVTKQRLIVLDLYAHDDEDWAFALGHKQLGFEPSDLVAPGFRALRTTRLANPRLFVRVLERT